MSNDLVISENSGAARGGEPATSGQAGGVERPGFASPPANSTRLAEISQIMRTDIDRYWSEGLDKEHFAMLQADTGEEGNPTAPMVSADSREMLCSSAEGQKLVQQWERYGGFGVHLASVQKDAGAIVRAVGNGRAQRAFMTRFDRDVPEAARLAVYDEIASGPPTFVLPASDAEVRLFAGTPAGKALVAEWGSSAAEKVAILRDRAARLTEQMYDDEAEDFWDWFDGLEVTTAAAIFRKLAG